MSLRRVAAAYLRQAEARLEDAGDALKERNFPYALRLSQETVELSLKATLKRVGIEYPKVHDVSDVLLRNSERFPRWFQDQVTGLAESSQLLSKKRELSLYGGEESFLSPEDVISQKDASDAVKRARKCFSLVKRLLPYKTTKRHSQ